MRISYYLLFFILAIWLVSCGPSEEDKARSNLNRAQALLEKGDTLTALRQLDSIPLLFSKAIYAVNAAGSLSQEILFDLLHRKEAQMDSLEVRITELEKPFRKEKTEFDRYTQYIHRRQSFERSWKRSFIQVHLDERGEISLSSNYHGEKWLNHNALRVYDRGDDARTEVIPPGDPDNHRSDFMEAKWEKVTYRNGRDNGILEFISQNADRNLKAVFLGNEYHYIILEEYDKQAVVDALNLSGALKQRMKLQAEVQSLKKRLGI